MASKMRITLDQLRIAAKVGKKYQNPCYEQVERLASALPAAGYKINGPIYKYVQEADECYAKADIEEKKKGKATTLYHLTKHLDRKKFKKGQRW